MTPSELIATAEKLWTVQLSALPFRTSKEGDVSGPIGWTAYCDNPPSQETQVEFRELFHAGYDSILLACGRVINGRRLVCIDVDDDRLVRLVETILGPTVSGRFGSKGIGVFVWVDSKNKKFKNKFQVKVGGRKLGIEFLSKGSGTFVPPSRHRTTGKAYEWRGRELWDVLDGLPNLTQESWNLIQTCVEFTDVEALLDNEETHGPAMRLCASLVRHTEDNDLIIRSVQSLFHLEYQGTNNSDREILRFIKSARDKGFDQAGSGTPEKTLRRFEKINETHCVVSVGGRTMVLEKAYDVEMKRYAYQFSNYTDFKNFHIEDLVIVGEKLDGNPLWKSVGEAWFHWSNRAKAHSVNLLPDYEPGLVEIKERSIYNVWAGFNVEPEKGDWSLIEDHLRRVICSGDDEHYEYLIHWLARCVQRPDVQGEVAVVLRGGRGTGKGTVGRMLAGIFGQHYFHASSQGLVAGRFNNHLRDTVVLFADEAFFAGDKKHEGVLKALITEDFLAIEAKFVNVVQTRNRLHIVMATNAEWAIPTGVDERRFFALKVSDVQKQDHSYFSKLNEQMAKGGLAAMLFALQEMDLKTFNVRDIPHTAELDEQKAKSLDAVEDWLLRRLEEGKQTVNLDAWEAWVPTRDLFDDFTDYTRAKNARPVSDNVFGKRLRLILGAEPFRPAVDQSKMFLSESEIEKIEKNPLRVRALKFEKLEDCRKRFDKYLGFGTDWLSVVGEEPQEPKF